MSFAKLFSIWHRHRHAGDLSVQRVRGILRMPTNIADDAEAFDEALSNTPSCFCELMQLRYNRHGQNYEWKQTNR